VLTFCVETTDNYRMSTTVAPARPSESTSSRARRQTPSITADQIAQHARRADTRRRLIDALESIDNDDCDLGRISRFKQTLVDGEAHSDLLDNCTIAHAAAELMQPRRALEIGVRRGFTSCAIVAAARDVEHHMMDSWRPVYSDRPNPGPVLVRKQLIAAGHRGRPVFHQGNSHELLPRLFQAEPNLQFDILVVDGDHTEHGAEQDLADTFPRVARGGVLIFDDLMHPSHRYLLNVWRRWANKLGSDFTFAEYLDDGLGVGWAVRR
jgi:predicted O-methyltransferase YrrM